MGDLVPFNGSWRDVVDAQLAELNTRATATLDRMAPAPDGLPPAGSWIRVVKLNDDGQGKPVTPWHHVVGWDGPIGCLSTRCRRRTSFSEALNHYLGLPPRWYDRSRGRLRLLVRAERPADDACGQCTLGLERDAAAAAKAQRDAELEALHGLLPRVRAIATDPALDDSERGRQLRLLWPTA